MITVLFVIFGFYASSAIAKVNDTDAACFVGQREYRVATSAEMKALKTFGVSTCIAVTLYNPRTKTGALVHFDASTPVEDTLERIKADFAEKESALCMRENVGCEQQLQVNIISGHDRSNERQRAEIKNRLQRFKNISFIEKVGTRKIESVWLDLSTGEVSTFQPLPGLQSNRLRRLPRNIRKAPCFHSQPSTAPSLPAPVRPTTESAI